ncbi:hypothetical protein H257_10049 [Aphanomyces astaci]|uniref:Peptidase M48 domain-containing protein n=1 Tax=Aphanomyces astaci TaxID=112090 RepID=W4G9D8_APHAT|nr:hypothetical protein H257_10049 [Aphanomyces astaci]ETV75654.1 hypothetical protein H257_10049 [Aphanomyces astaci]RQM23493.1 hypothetical protein B5M09_004190 [Aphanomyces astaci]|eukprot:XP_009834785.1 hypothetical protein H257_10049 [Aphanomyces astaci]
MHSSCPMEATFVYRGILPIAKTYGGLACVLGHEMARAMALHSAEKFGFFDLVLVLHDFLRGVSGGTSDVGGRGWKAALMEFLLVTVFQVVVPLAFSRRMEGKADYMGMVLAVRTGYDPREASPLWKRMMDATMETPPSRESDLHVAAPEAFLGDLLSTHPSSQSRIHDLYEYATTILWEFQLATDKLAFAQVMRDSTALLPLISTA